MIVKNAVLFVSSAIIGINLAGVPTEAAQWLNLWLIRLRVQIQWLEPGLTVLFQRTYGGKAGLVVSQVVCGSWILTWDRINNTSFSS